MFCPIDHNGMKCSFFLFLGFVLGSLVMVFCWWCVAAVDNTRVMLGTFAPQREPHVVMMEEETTPSGMLARGTYSAKTKVSSS